MKILKDPRLYVVITCLTLIWSINQYLRTTEQIIGLQLELERIEAQKDSLREELFINKVDIGRYELTIDHLKEYDPKAYKEFDRFLSHETE